MPKRQFEELVIRAAQDFEAFYADRQNALAPTQMATTAERQAVDACADYLLKYAPYLDYDKALADGLPIATGVIEGIKCVVYSYADPRDPTTTDLQSSLRDPTTL